MSDFDLIELDALDRDILRHLQAEGRLSKSSSATSPPGSPTTC
jgi:DNA-binding Lrp family transcriptional regulator